MTLRRPPTLPRPSLSPLSPSPPPTTASAGTTPRVLACGLLAAGWLLASHDGLQCYSTTWLLCPHRTWPTYTPRPQEPRRFLSSQLAAPPFLAPPPRCVVLSHRPLCSLLACWLCRAGWAAGRGPLNRRRGGGRGPTGGGPTPDGSTGAEAGRWNDETPAPIERRLYNKPTPRVVAPATYLLTTINPRQRQRDDDLRSLRARTARRFLQRGTERSKTELKKMRGVRGR